MIGSGRLATQLGMRLLEVGIPIAQVVSRNADHARMLGARLGCASTDQIAEVHPDTNWVILAVSDSAIGRVAEELAAIVPHALVTHTSGATPGAVLGMYFRRYGVLYPLQTFSLEKPVQWDGLPICVDASQEADTRMLVDVALQLGGSPQQLGDEQRAWVHLAAVFANNFANHCFAIADELLTNHALSFDLMHPLMRETVARALTQSPRSVQTGPAVRDDQITQEAHLVLLKSDMRRSELYRLMSADIWSTAR